MIIKQCTSCNTYCLKGQIKDGKCTSCRALLVVEQERQELEPLEVDQTSQEIKKCVKCKTEKPLNLFKEDKRAKDKLRKACMDCE